MDFIDHRSTAQFTFLTSATDEKIRINADGDLLVGISTPFDTSGITLDATGALGVDGHIRVASGATYDIGSATNKFRNLYLSGDINVAGASTSGDLTVGGSLSVTTDATVTGDLTVSTDATVAGDLTVSTNATITNDLTVSNDATISGDLTVSTNAVIAGDLTVNGTTTTINTETLDVKDKNITLNYGGDTTSANGAGITIEDAVSAGNDATILWDGSNDTFDFSHAIDVTGTITADNNLTIQNSNAYGSIEVGGVSGGFIDIKRPFSDDYDLRLIAEGDGGVINVASGELTIQRAGSAKLATSSAGVDVTGDIAVSGTVDGRDVATDGLKLDGIEASADVTDTTNVTAAGALMDSEVTNLDQVKAFDSSDYATAAQGSTADSALQNVVEDTTPQLGGDLDLNGNDITGTGNIDVTGTATMDGLDVQGNVIINNSYAYQIGGDSASTSVIGKMHNSSGVFTLASLDSRHMKLTTSNADRLKVDANGDISFYDSAGSSQSLFWDASTEFLGLGSTTPQAKLDIVDTASDVQMRVYKFDGTKNTRITLTADDSGAKIHYRDADNAGALRFNNNLGEVMRITANTTRLGIGTSNPTTELEVDGVITTAGLTTTADINFGDNDKAIFGAGSDLQIYHDGTHSYIKDAGTGNLNILASTSINLLNGDSSDYMARFNDNGSNQFFYDGSQKLATTSTGIDVTGSVVSDGLTLDNNGSVIFNAPQATDTVLIGTNDNDLVLRTDDGDIILKTNENKQQLKVSNNGDISFYEDTGTTAKLFWDASAEALGIGTSSPEKLLHLKTSAINTAFARIESTATNSYPTLSLKNDAREYQLTAHGPLGDVFTIYDGTAGSHRLIIDSSGNVGIGTSSPDAKFHSYQSAANYAAHFESANANSYGVWVEEGASANNGYPLLSVTDNGGSTQYFRVDSGTGNVGIGTSSPSSVLHLSTSNDPKITLTDTGFGASADITGSNGNLRLNSQTATIFDMADSEVARIDSSGNVGIGTSSPNSYSNLKTLTINGTNGSVVDFETNGTLSGEIFAESNSLKIDAVGSSGVLKLLTNSTERMRIDASGNLLVGKTATAFGTAGVAVFGGGEIDITNTNEAPLFLNRLSSDGAIAQFYKDGTAVGSIGTQSGNPYIGGTNRGIRFDSTQIIPADMTASGSNSDNSIDIGNSGVRFKNLYLSGTANVGGVAVIGTDATDVASIGTAGQRVYIKPNGTEIIYNASGNSAGQHVWQTGNAERVRIDASGNLLVGKTDTSIATQGVFFGPNYSHITSTNDTPLALSRKSSDGTILDIRKDGTTVGSIFNSGTTMGVGSLDTGVLLANNIDAILPWNASTNAERDAAIDLGRSSGRFKNLYLSGNVTSSGTFRGGAGSASTPTFLTDGSTGMFRASSNDIGFSCAGSEVARFDSSGNLMVGTSDTFVADNTSGNGLSYRASAGDLGVAATNTPAFYANRMSSDGTIVDFRKDGTSVGSIGSNAAGGTPVLDISANTSSGIMRMLTSGSERMRIDSSGNVGINTSSPTSVQGFAKVLKLEDSSNASIVVSGGLHEAEYAVSSSGGWFGTSTNIPQRFITNNTERMRIDSTGRVGLGTNSPDVKLDIVDTAADVQLRVYKFDGTNNTRLTLTADDSGAKIHYRDATNGGALRFNNNAGEMARFDASSNLLVGTTAPHPAGNNTAGMSVGTGIGLSVQGANTALTIGVPSAQTYGMAFRFQGALAGRIGIEANNITVADVSDYRLKENVAPLSDALTKIKALKPSSFNFINYPDKTHEGFIAHELQEVIPYAVSGEKDALITEATKDRGTVGEIDPQAVDLRKLVPTLVAAIQELSAQVESLTARIEALES